MPAAQLLITADDFGWTDGHNLAVERAHKEGLLGRASLLCNGDAFFGAVALARRCPGLGVGVHLTLSEGRPLLPPARLPNLCGPDGAFFSGLPGLLGRYAQGRLHTEEAQAEWAAQIERALSAGLQLTHLDSHKHVHLLPPLLPAAIALARQYGVPYLRLPLERPSPQMLRRPGWPALYALCLRARPLLQRAGLAFADRFLGFGDSGGLSVRRLSALLSDATLPAGQTVEIMVHPAVRTEAVEALSRRYLWARRYRFEDELAALCDPGLVSRFRSHGPPR